MALSLRGSKRAPGSKKAFRLTALLFVLPAILAASTTGKTERAPGLQKAVFQTPDGSVTVHFPDDVRAGDTLSGVVVAEPEGDSEKRRLRNQDRLDGLVVDMEGQRNGVNQGLAKWTIPAAAEVIVRLLDPKGRELARTSVPVQPTAPHEFSTLPGVQEDVTDVVLNLKQVPSNARGRETPPAPRPSKPAAPVSPDDFRLPTMGQTGRTVTCAGPFDGDIGTTAVTVDGKEVRPLAEGPRHLVFESPRDVTGRTALHLKERDVECEGTYRSLAVRLSAPTTHLTRGQTTTLSIIVEGLKGLSEEVHLEVKKSGAVSMAGGDEQVIAIKPADVGPTGSCAFERTITGVEAGAFNVVATVKVPETVIRLTEPSNGATVSEPRPRFSWTVEHPPADMIYAVKIAEGQPGRPLQEAILGFPHWVGTSIPSTTWTYPPEAPPLRPGATYAVIVKGVLGGAVVALSGPGGFLFRPELPSGPSQPPTTGGHPVASGESVPPPGPGTSKSSAAVCGPDVTAALVKTLFGLETAFERLDPKEQATLCRSLILPTGTNAWDIEELRARGWLAQYTPPCCVPPKPCALTVTVDGRCFYAGSLNYVVFGVMAGLCWGNTPDTANMIRNLIYLYKGPVLSKETLDRLLQGQGVFKSRTWEGADNWLQSMQWALAGLTGWHTGRSRTPAGERITCSPTRPRPYPNDHFRVMWDTHPNILEEAGMYGYCPYRRCGSREKIGEEVVIQDWDQLWVPCPVPGCPGARVSWTKGTQKRISFRQKVERCTLPSGHISITHRLAQEYAFFSEVWRTERFEKWGETLSECAHTWPAAAFDGERERLIDMDGRPCVDVQ